MERPSYLRLPVECLNRSFRSAQKSVEHDLQGCVAALVSVPTEANSNSATPPTADAAAGIERIDVALRQLEQLKRNIEETHAEQQGHIACCQRRVDGVEGVEGVGVGSSSGGGGGGESPLSSLLPHYMLRRGFFKSVATIDNDSDEQNSGSGGGRRTRRRTGERDSSTSSTSSNGGNGGNGGNGDGGLVRSAPEVAVFQAAHRVCDALRRRDCLPALAWCAENRARLRRLDSPLELHLRVQEFIQVCSERVSCWSVYLERGNHNDAYLNPIPPTSVLQITARGDLTAAVAYSRKHFTSALASHCDLVKRAMGLLAFPDMTTMGAHRELTGAPRWEELQRQFGKVNRLIHGIAPEPLLVQTIKAGLAALQTSQCGHCATVNIDCPACDPYLRLIAQHLPLGHHVRTRLVCRISGKVTAD